jgi:ketosteroid isomerase-like protein
MSIPNMVPVTGREHSIDPREPAGALAEFYRAFNGRDLALIERNWDSSDEVAMDNPLGGICRGWSDIRRVYERIFNGAAVVTVELHDYTMHRFGEMFYAVGREQGTLRAAGQSLELKIRTSRVFRFVGGRWRQVHHHGSIDDANLLARYQTAVR